MFVLSPLHKSSEAYIQWKNQTINPNMFLGLGLFVFLPSFATVAQIGHTSDEQLPCFTLRRESGKEAPDERHPSAKGRHERRKKKEESLCMPTDAGAG